MNQSTMSKKAAIAGMAMTAIGSADDWKKMAFIAGIAVVAMLAQAVLDWRKG